MNYLIAKNILISLIIIAICGGCDILDNWALSEIPNEHEFQQTLSDYKLFEGQMADLSPSAEVEVFNLTTELFTDYASKQRLIKLPKNEIIAVNSDGSFNYPNNTLIAKTFYYPRTTNNRTQSNNSTQARPKSAAILGPGFLSFFGTQELNIETLPDKHILETRILLKIDGTWNVAVYEWNREQTEAYLITEGTKRNVKWIDKNNEVRTTRYRIPSLAECTTCHQSSKKVLPIGPKLSNMDHDIKVNDKFINQLDYLEASGVISSFNRDNIQYFPDWNNTEYPLELRARAYLDVNCAHCHNPTGIADHTSLYFLFGTSLSGTGITTKKNQIQRRIQSRWRGEKMPMIGTTVIHDEGVKLIKEYLDSL